MIQEGLFAKHFGVSASKMNDVQTDIGRIINLQDMVTSCIIQTSEQKSSLTSEEYCNPL